MTIACGIKFTSVVTMVMKVLTVVTYTYPLTLGPAAPGHASLHINQINTMHVTIAVFQLIKLISLQSVKKKLRSISSNLFVNGIIVDGSSLKQNSIDDLFEFDDIMRSYCPSDSAFPPPPTPMLLLILIIPHIILTITHGIEFTSVVTMIIKVLHKLALLI